MPGIQELEEIEGFATANFAQNVAVGAMTDMEELWRRLVFNILISNTDDHLRNHGFLYAGREGWRLSPAYDLNPIPTDIKPAFLAPRSMKTTGPLPSVWPWRLPDISNLTTTAHAISRCRLARRYCGGGTRRGVKA